MRVQSGFNGKRLKAARLYRGLTISEVAKMSDVSKQAISQFENSKAEPKLETLMKIMQILKFPREYFYENPEDKVVVGDTYFRSLSSTSNKERLAQIECVKLLVAIYRGIDEYIAFPELNLYTVPEDFDFNVETIILLLWNKKWLIIIITLLFVGFGVIDSEVSSLLRNNRNIFPHSRH